jgi:hypothetical protein
MVHIVELPNGQEAEFPDSMSQEQILSAISRQFPRGGASAPQQSKPSLSQQMMGATNPDLLGKAANFAQKNIVDPMEQNVINPLIGAIGGAEETVANTIPGLFNLGAKAVNALGGNVNEMKGFHFTPEKYKGFGHTAGEAAGYFAGPGLLKAGGKAIESIPQLGKFLSELGGSSKLAGAAKDIGGNAFVGAAMTPENQGLAAILGGLGGAIPSAGKAVGDIKNSALGKKAGDYFRNYKPEEQASLIHKELSQGSKNLYENTKSLASDIRQAHKMREEESGAFFNHVKGRAGNEKIYDKPDPLISTALDKSKNLIEKAEGFNIGSLFNSFKRNPTFSNAHALQSELFDMTQSYKGRHLSMGERAELSHIKSVRDQLKNDISEFLAKRDASSNENLLPLYQKGSELYKENVSPYLQNKKFIDIIKGGKTAVKNLHDVFNMPANVIDKKTGAEKLGSINKIMQDLPEVSKNKILFGAIGGQKGSASDLSKALMDARNKGFSPYFSKNLDESIELMSKKMSNKEKADAMKKKLGLTGLVGGGSLGSALLAAQMLKGNKEEKVY